MAVTFHDLATRIQRDLVKRVGELAEAATGARHQAAFAQHAAVREAARFLGRPICLQKLKVSPAGICVPSSNFAAMRRF